MALYKSSYFSFTCRDVTCVSVCVPGTTNTGGRILAGFLADLKRVNGLLLHNVSLVCAGLLCFVNMFCLEYVSMCVFAALFGLCIGMLQSVAFPTENISIWFDCINGSFFDRFDSLWSQIFGVQSFNRILIGLFLSNQSSQLGITKKQDKI